MQFLPNLLTLLNLFFGCCAIVSALYFQIETAALCILGSFVCDYADGMAARALGVTSPIGKELDSLADVVSFGVVPATLLYAFLSRAMCGEFEFYLNQIMLDSGLIVENQAPATANVNVPCIGAMPAFLLPLFGAYRLAKFNIDTRQTTYFLGLSTPAATLFVLGLVMAAHNNQYGIGYFFLDQPWMLYIVILLLGLLMVSDIPMFGLKVKSLSWKNNEALILLLVFGAVLIFLLQYLALPILVVVYIVASLVLKNRVVG
jgi:CDP-diacylglycerol---serine O-phosphatidyltransferase